MIRIYPHWPFKSDCN